MRGDSSGGMCLVMPGRPIGCSVSDTSRGRAMGLRMWLASSWMLIFAVAASPCCGGEAYKPTAEEMAAAKLLGLVPPVEVTYTCMYDDGGTVGFRLDGEEKTRVEGNLSSAVLVPWPQSIYLRAFYPSGRGQRRRLELGGSEDRAVVYLIRAWSNRMLASQGRHEPPGTASGRQFRSSGQRDALEILRWLEFREPRLALYQNEDSCARILGLEAPVALAQVVPPDSSGSTLGFVLRDRRNKEVRACFYRMASNGLDGVWIGSTASIRNKLGARNTRLVSGSEEETAVLGLLNHWFERHPPGAGEKRWTMSFFTGRRGWERPRLPSSSPRKWA